MKSSETHLDTHCKCSTVPTFRHHCGVTGVPEGEKESNDVEDPGVIINPNQYTNVELSE